MNKFDRLDELSKLLQQYRKSKNRDKELFSSEAAIQKALSNRKEEERAYCLGFFNDYQSYMEEFKEHKKGEKNFRDELVQLVEAIFIDDNKDVKDAYVKDVVPLKTLATVTFIRELELQLALNDEERKDAVSSIIDQGWYDLLQIDEKAYLDFSREMKEQTGQHIYGVIEVEKVTTKVR